MRINANVAGISFFREVTAYPRRPWQDPKENRLTSAFVATVARVPAVCADLVSAWLGVDVAEPIKVVTQRRSAGGVVDVEIQFGTNRKLQRVVWIEVKHRSGLSGDDQLDRYADALAEAYPTASTDLVLLAPAAFAADGAAPAVRATWESVHRAVIERARTEEDVVAHWLLHQLAIYLEEEGLHDVPLTPAIVQALTVLTELESAFTRLMQHALTQLTREWPSAREAKRTASGLDFQTFVHNLPPQPVPKSLGCWEDARLEWGLDATDAYPDEPVFWAGLWSGPRGPLANPENERWIAELEVNGFSVEQDRRDVWLLQTLEPKQLLSHADVVSQGHALAAFVAETFRLLTDVPPAAWSA